MTMISAAVRGGLSCAACALVTSACATRPSAGAAERNARAVASARAEDARVELHSLAAPFATPSAERPMVLVSRPPGAALIVADRWTIAPWASLPGRVRQAVVAPNGDVLATDSDGATVLRLRDEDGDGVAEAPTVFARGLDLPFGIALNRSNADASSIGWLYVANTSGVVRWPYSAGDAVARGRPQRVLALPGHGYHQHWTRSIAIDERAHTLFVSVGSETNVEPESDARRAAITACALDGTSCRVFASGLRNATGLAIEPSTGALIAAVNERDELGDELPPDYLTRVREGGFYGWPYAYWGANEDPRRAGERPDLVARSIRPDFSLGAHAAPIAVLFARALGGDALVTLHGSWNRSRPHGYEVWRVHFERGVPVSSTVFVRGWRIDERRAWGRPAGLAEAPDGSVVLIDDGSRTMFRLRPPR
ncbi:MAG: PQQ-dependent sugar dehydrogenase [Polyangiales bacterium]